MYFWLFCVTVLVVVYTVNSLDLCNNKRIEDETYESNWKGNLIVYLVLILVIAEPEHNGLQGEIGTQKTRKCFRYLQWLFTVCLFACNVPMPVET